ncbi:MAG: TetR/AcrR family transcriptional regulator [Chloroflexota bacterium]
MPAKEKPDDLREAIIETALAIIESDGLEKLSLRQVARQIGVSHQAPYKHFANRDHILAEVVQRTFDDFASYLDVHPTSDDPRADMAQMGRAYVQYALSHPTQYRLMFGTPLPDAQAFPEMMVSARHAFDLLKACIQRLPNDAQKSAQQIELDALFVWSTMHGLTSLLETQAMQTHALSAETPDTTIAHVLHRIGVALGVEFDPPPMS